MNYRVCASALILVSLYLKAGESDRVHAQELIDLSKATIIVSDGQLAAAEKVAPAILSEEVMYQV
jgi:hypothetical protein